MRRTFIDELYITRASQCGKNCSEKEYRACVFSKAKEQEGDQDVIMEYGATMIFNRCIIENRLLYGDLWTVYIDYQHEKLYYKLPFLIGYMLQIIETDRFLLLEAERKRKKK